jgi:hypothetical protein
MIPTACPVCVIHSPKILPARKARYLTFAVKQERT